MHANHSAHIQLLADLPPVVDDGFGNLAFCSADDGVLWLCYEVRRDFLSAPRQFNVLRVVLADEPFIATGGQYLNDLQWESLRKAGFGIYRVEVSELVEGEGELHLVCYTPKQIVECCALQVTSEQQCFHAASPYQALVSFLTG